METRREFFQKTVAAGIAGIIASRTAPAFAQERISKGGVTLEEAWDVHRRCLIIDGHNDGPVERVARKENPINWMKVDTAYQTDVPRMTGNGQQYAGFMIVGNGKVADVWITTERTQRLIDRYPQKIMKVLSSADAVHAGKSGKLGVIFSIEGPAKWLEVRIETVHILHRLGIREMSITHGEGGKEPEFLQGAPSAFRFCTAQERETMRKDEAGLTAFGREVLKAQNELGMVTDVSHINDKTFYDVIGQTTTPPISSHTNVFGLCPHTYNMTDDQLRALAAKGGVIGIIPYHGLLDTDPKKETVDRVVDHILYVADMVGIDTVGIGSDFDGGSDLTDVSDGSHLMNLTHAMLARGLTEKEIQKVWGGNFLRVLRQTIDKPGK
ncbi:MAG: dipeptidase [Candidatus Latescibacterota bacterium]